MSKYRTNRQCACVKCGYMRVQAYCVGGSLSPCVKCGGRMRATDALQNKRDAKAKAELAEQEQ